VRRSGAALAGQPPGQQEFVLDPRSEPRFEVHGAGAVLEFRMDEAGLVNVLLHQNG
jgi:hypothetical protein